MKLSTTSDGITSSAEAPIAATTATAEAIRSASWRVLPHEWAFGAFLLATALRLTVHGQATDWDLLFYAVFAAGVCIGIWAAASPTPLRWRVRLLWYPTAMGISFYALAGGIAALAEPRVDALLSGWDQQLLGARAFTFLSGLQTPAFTDLMVISYLFFFWYLIAGPAHYCLRDLPRLRSCFVGLFTLYALGFLGYTLLPAAGPHLAADDGTQPEGGSIARTLLPIINAASNGSDAFPSIHVAVSFYLLAFDAYHYRRRFFVTLLPCVLLWISTIYLHYHYFVDVIAGFALGLFGLAICRLYDRSGLARHCNEAQ